MKNLEQKKRKDFAIRTSQQSFDAASSPTAKNKKKRNEKIVSSYLCLWSFAQSTVWWCELLVSVFDIELKDLLQLLMVSKNVK